MSHFTVAVFHKKNQDIAKLLAPYDENLEVDSFIWKTKEEAISYARENYETEGMTDEECWNMMSNGAETDAEGNIYTTYNPKSKWDWWTEGGRYSDMLKTKTGETVDSGRIADLDFSPDKEEYENALHFWDVVVDHKPQKPDEEIQSFWNEQYYKDYYGDRETYAKTMASFSTYAVITPDGEWHAPGEMGWFGCSSEGPDESKEWYAKYKERFIDSADPDLYLTIVDCHI